MDDTIYRQDAIDALMAWEEDSVWDDECLKHRGEPYWVAPSDVIEQMPSAQPQRWIPVSERLPEEGGRYLISVLDGVVRRTTVAPYQPRYKAWTMTGRMAYWKVVAWMPLPEPYTERWEE